MSRILAQPDARGEIVWSPGPGAADESPLGSYLAWLREQQGRSFTGYEELRRWSVDDLEGFWGSLAEHFALRWHAEPTEVLASRAMPGARWFPGATLNYAEHALAQAAITPDAPAVIAHSQTRDELTLTWRELADQVARCRAGLLRLGVTEGDRVAAFAPNIPETLVCFLATASLGAVFASCAPEFGTQAVVDRLAQIAPKVLLAVDGYRYGTKVVDRREEVTAISAALPSLEHLVMLRYLGAGPDEWSGLLADPGPLEFAPVPFDHPLYVLSSSGTTGLPKPIVHGHGAMVLEHRKQLELHTGIVAGERFAWFTTTGWMMWNYLVSGLLSGATIVLFDGDPGAPDLTTLWRLAADLDLDVLGVSAPFLMACRKAGIEVPPHRLRVVGSTGAPLPADGFRWVRDVVGGAQRDGRPVQPASLSGGTDVCTGFVGVAPILPVRAGEISCRMLGCAVEAFTADGEICPPGVQGELVVTEPMPSMPVGFWGDTDGSRMRAAYFDDFPGVWRHGDWITFTDDGACVISGRSDATLNRGGVRLGTSDYYALVEALPEVADSLVVFLEGDDDDASGRLLLFVQLAPDVELDAELRGRITRLVREELSPRHTPDEIVAVPAVPRTLSGKKLEVPVKRVLLGAAPDAVASRSSLADPTALDWFAGISGDQEDEDG